MQTITTVKYIGDDGVEYNTKAEAEKADKALENSSFFRINCKPDLTEGRGYNGCIWVMVMSDKYKYGDLMLLEDYCYRTIGRKAAFVQGVCPMDNWKIFPATYEDWKENRGLQIGGYNYPAQQLILRQGDRETGLELWVKPS